MLTPFKIRTLLTLAAKEELAVGQAAAYSAATKKLHDSGLIDSLRQITPRGEAFIAMLCATPLPEATWIDPRTGSSVKTTDRLTPWKCPKCGVLEGESHMPDCAVLGVFVGNPETVAPPPTVEWRCAACGAEADEIHSSGCPRAAWRCPSCGVEAGGLHRFDCIRFKAGEPVLPMECTYVR